MFRRQRSGRTRWVVAAAATLALVGGGLAVALPASAATAVTDGFEGNPYDRWRVEESKGNSFVELTNHQGARSGSKIAWLEAYPASNNRARISHTVTLDNPGGCCGSFCFATAYLSRPYIGPINGGPGEARPEMPRVTLQILAGGPAGLPIDSASYDLPAVGRGQETWGRADFANFDYRPGPITIDITVRSGTAYVDDVSLSCLRNIT
jgi:hypothetical protein